MKKLTGEQVLKILEDNFEEEVSNFAYNELGELIPDDFKFSEEVEKIGKVKSEARELWLSCEKEKKEESDALYKSYGELPSAGNREVEEYFTSLGLGEVVEVEQVGGEDQGSDWYSIKHFVYHDVYIKTSGWYASHHGTDFEEGIGEIVKPVQKTITVFI